MELNDDYISLRKYKDDEDKIWLILEAGMKKTISLYLQSTASYRLRKLCPNQIQQIRSSLPGRTKMVEEIINYSIGRGRVEEHFQLVSFSDLWINKIDAAKFLVEPPINPPLIPSSSHSNEVEKDTMLKLILGMAMRAYGFDPAKPRNTATGSNNGSIKADLEKCGLPIDEDTVRKYLNEAKGIYPHAYIKAKNKILQD